MYLSDGGATPPAFLQYTTAAPEFVANLDTTEYPVFDTTGSVLATTDMPWWELTQPVPLDTDGVNIPQSLIRFGQAFESQKSQPIKSQPDLGPVLDLSENTIVSSRVPVGGRTQAGVFLPIDIPVNIDLIRKLYEKFPDLVLKKSDRLNDSSKCHPFPFCGEEGCSGIGLSFFVALELLLLVLIVAANVAIISVLRDMNNSSKNRHYRSNNVFKLSLAIADLCLGLTILPAGIQSSISALIDQNFNVGNIQIASLGSIPAIIFGSGAVIATIVAIWSILFIQVDLFFRIRWPVEQHCNKLLNTKRARIITVLIWCFSVGIVVALWPLGFSFAIQPATLTYSPILLPKVENGSLVTSAAEKMKIPLYALIVWGVPFLMTIPLGIYLAHAIGKACKKLRRRTQASYIGKRQTELNEQKSRVKKDWEAAVRTMVVELVYVVTFLPTIIAHIVFWEHDGCDPRANIFHFCAQFILVVGSFLNLFVYHLMWKDFQTRLRALFCGQSPSPSKSRSGRKTVFHSQHGFHSQTTTSHISTISELNFPIKITTDTPIRKK